MNQTSQTLPFETTLMVKDRCLCLSMQRAARVMARRFDLALKPFGLTNGQFSLLMALNRPEPARISDLAPFLGVDRTTLTAALKVLEREGLASAAPDPSDKRSRRAALLPAGHARLIAALPAWAAAHDDFDATLTTGTLGALRSALERIAAPSATE